MNPPLSVLNAENFEIEALSCSERVKLDALMDVAVYEKSEKTYWDRVFFILF